MDNAQHLPPYSEIRILPTYLVNRIAAGEVIERPASAVKELVENALDAGATRIEITAEDSGKRYISVRDNGRGMSRTALELAIIRHATSKLPDDDLLNIRTLGFRGEALPSIGAVSRLRITSRSADETEHGWQQEVEAGTIHPPIPAPCPIGTLIEVRDLFFATPARLKFLKSDTTEAQAIVDVITRLAMANPQAAFHLHCNGRERVHIPASEGTLLSDQLPRLAALLGKDFTHNALSVDMQRDQMHVRGYCGLPTYHRSTAQAQYLFVNQRPVRDPQLTGAVRGAYQDVLARGRHPAVVLFLSIPPELVDVNVHPAKTEVRFRYSTEVRGLIVSALRRALDDGAQRSSSTVAEQTLAVFEKGIKQHSVPSVPIQPTTTPELLPINTPPLARHFTAREHQPLMHFKHSSPAMHQFVQDSYAPQTTTPAPTPTADTPPEDTPEPTPEYPLGAARAQLHNTYIVSETSNGLVIVDQHAAHERIVYERMKTQLHQQHVPAQGLLMPEIIELGNGHASLLLAQREALATCGMQIEQCGDDAVMIRSLPALLRNTNIGRLVRDMAEELAETGHQEQVLDAIHEVCASMACHGSIRAGRQLSIEEMNQLLRDMENTPYSGQCNHGRPTYITLSLQDIERLFGRT